MRNIIRLSPTATLRLTPRPIAPGPSPAPQKPSIKLKPKSRQPLTGITNLSAPRATEQDDPPTIVIPPSRTSPRRAPCDVRVPGPFIRIRHIQRGCFSEAVAVRDLNGGRELRGRVLCLKIFEKKEAAERCARHVIIQELLAYKAISAVTGDKWLPFVMRLDASLEDAFCLYFAMDLMDCDLLDILTHWPSSDRSIYKKQWIAQIATGISAIHDAGIMHRDIKPENILIDFRRNVRIADFGCAFVNPDNKALHRYGEYCVEVCGTWPYQAPELLANERRALVDRRKYGIAVDYWALGCIIFELELEDTRTLFDTKADLKAYQNYRSAFHHGKSYLDEFALSENAEDLIIGLLRVSPGLRFGEEISRHSYFKTPDGVSEFETLEVMSDPNVADEVPRVEADDGEDEIYCPAAYPCRVPPTEGSYANHCWINPAGIWGTHRQ